MNSPDRFTIGDDLIRAYSRRGNFHTDEAQSERLGLPGLVAQGTQATGRAFGLLIDAWGAEFLEHGMLDLRFIGMVVGGDEIESDLAFGPDNNSAAITVRNISRDRIAVVGTADLRTVRSERG